MKTSWIDRIRMRSIAEGMQISSSGSRRCCIVMLALLGGFTVSMPEKGRAAVTLAFAAAATAVDDGLQDGVFDAFTPLNIGSVNNNGWTSFRTALQFDLSALPPGAIIHSASLDAVLNNHLEGTRQIALSGYAGDGTVHLSDFALNGLVGVKSVGPTPTGVSFDVTSFLSQLQSSGAPFAGFNFQEDPANQFNLTVMYLTMGGYDAPRLSVDYILVPEPAGLALFGLGVALLVLVRRKHSAAGPDSRALSPWQSRMGSPGVRWRWDRTTGRAVGLLPVMLLAGLLAGCATTTAPPPADPHLLDFLRDGQSTKEAVVLKLGQPSSVLESGRILTYRLGQENIRGYFLREAGNTNWFELKFSLILVFDSSEVLQRHSLVEVR